MARPIKEGLDYFPMDVDILHNIKIRRAIKQYGEKGFMAYAFLLCEIYKNSYYIEIKDNEVFELSDLFGITEDESLQMLDGLVNLKLFDAEMWKTKRILTSVEIQKRYFTAKIKKSINIKTMPYLLDMAIIPVKTQVIAEKTPVNSEEMPQSKVKESKVKESIVKESKVKNLYSSSSSSACACAQEANGVIVLEEEIKKPNSFSENCKKWNAELMKDEEWLSSVVRSSGKGSPILGLLPEIMDYFEQHIVSIGETGSMLNINDYKRRLINWWRYLKFRSVPEILEQQNSKPRKNREEKKSKVDEAMECAQRASVIAQRLLDGGGL